MPVPMASSEYSNPGYVQPHEHVHVTAEPVVQPHVHEMPVETVEIVVPEEPQVVVEQVPNSALTPAVVLHLQRQAQVFLVARSILGFIEILLGLRFLLSLFGANPGAIFFDLVYNLSMPFVFLFEGLFRNPSYGTMVFELTTLFAMLFYLLGYWWLVRIVRLLATPPMVRH